LDKLREQEIKLKKQLNDQQLEIQSLKGKYNEISNKLHEETVETQQQLQVARHIANNLSDQLEEIQNFQASGVNPIIEENHNGDDNEISINIGNHNHDQHLKNMPFGKPLFEKRKTLKIITMDGKSLKLPNMSDLMGNIDENVPQSDDEYVDFASTKSPQPPQLKIISRRSSLPPVSEFHDSDDIDIDLDEKIRSPVMVTMRSQDSFYSVYGQSYESNTTEDDEKQRLLQIKSAIKRRHSDSTVMMKERNPNPSNLSPAGMAPEDDDDHVECNKHDLSAFPDTDFDRVSNHSHHSYEEDEIDKLLKRICGSSFNKYRNGNNINNGPSLIKLDSNTRDRLRVEIVKYIEQIKHEFENKSKEEKDILIMKYKKEVKQWEDKYKALKRENKRRKLKNAQKKQKSDEKPIAGCKFWSWSLSTRNSSYCNPQNTKMGKTMGEDLTLAEVNKILTANGRKKKVKFVVPDDSDDTVNSH